MIGSDDVLACFIAGNVFTIVPLGNSRRLLTAYYRHVTESFGLHVVRSGLPLADVPPQ